MTLVTHTGRVLTKTIADELIRLISASTAEVLLTAQTIDLGEPMQIAAVEQYADLLPAVLVKPAGASYTPGVLSATGTQYAVAESFRICYAYHVDSLTLDVWSRAISALHEIGLAISSDFLLSEIASTIAPSQVSSSDITGVEYEPFEDLLLRDKEIPVKVVALTWTVNWLSRQAGG